MSLKTVEDYILQQPESLQPLLRALQMLVKNMAPALHESIKWGMPAFAGKSNVFYLAAQKNYVNLGFYEGGSLADPHKLLEGTGAKMRHVKIRTLTDIQDKSLAELIRDAVVFQQN